MNSENWELFKAKMAEVELAARYVYAERYSIPISWILSLAASEEYIQAFVTKYW